MNKNHTYDLMKVINDMGIFSHIEFYKQEDDLYDSFLKLYLEDEIKPICLLFNKCESTSDVFIEDPNISSDYGGNFCLSFKDFDTTLIEKSKSLINDIIQKRVSLNKYAGPDKLFITTSKDGFSHKIFARNLIDADTITILRGLGETVDGVLEDESGEDGFWFYKLRKDNSIDTIFDEVADDLARMTHHICYLVHLASHCNLLPDNPISYLFGERGVLHDVFHSFQVSDKALYESLKPWIDLEKKIPGLIPSRFKNV